MNSSKTLTLGEAKQLSRALLQAGKSADARAVLNAVLTAAPADAEALLALGEVEVAEGHFSVARVLAVRAVALAPGIPAAGPFENLFNRIDSQLGSDSCLGSYLALRARHMDYPMNIQLETTARCNAKCTFCPHESLERKFDQMSDALYEKIIRDASAIPPSSPLNFYMNVVNEPFMDKKIFERMALLNDAIPHATIGLYTNLNVLPPNFFEKLAGVRRLNYFNISFNSANELEYRQEMGIDFHRTRTNIRRLLLENRTRGYFTTPVVLSRIATADDRDVRFVNECKQLLAEFECGREYVPVCKGRANWLGRLAGPQTPIPYLMPCMQWLNLSVLANGVVPHCCMDSKGEFAFGNAAEHSILEIYNSPRFRSYREAVAARETVYPCNTCALR
jgi:sulfatase maturation enzyme AslB (radical SAM superfamily)